MKNLSENTELLDFFQGVKQLKDIFFLFILLLIIVKIFECVFGWNSWGEFLLSISVSVTSMVAILAFFYNGNNSHVKKIRLK